MYSEYVKVDVRTYVSEGIAKGTLVPFNAVKFARIIARRGVEGEEVITWSADANGQAIVEKKAQVTLDETTHYPGWVATKANMDGEPLVDANGHTNDWIIPDSTFIKKYEVDPENPSIFKPKGGVQVFVQIPNNIILNQWGSDQQIAAGGYINITNPDDMYGISYRDFVDTYKREEELEQKPQTL
jgi:hypothetical protein